VILGDGQRLPIAQAMALARPRGGLDASPAMLDTPGVVTAAEMRRLEQENIQRAIERAGGRIYGPGGAAELLGLKPTTLAYRMKALGISRPPT
jgi:transcriptional regulator with GAF, ATPase, and Fis domain